MSDPTPIYLDVCTLCRPFDDQHSLRVRLETDALYLILEAVRLARYTLIVSPAHLIEIGATTHEAEDSQLLAFLERFGIRPSWNLAEARCRAEELYGLGFGAADAAHVALAERTAEAFITCDDALQRKCARFQVCIPVLGPVEFVAKEGIL